MKDRLVIDDPQLDRSRPLMKNIQQPSANPQPQPTQGISFQNRQRAFNSKWEKRRTVGYADLAKQRDTLVTTPSKEFTYRPHSMYDLSVFEEAGRGSPCPASSPPQFSATIQKKPKGQTKKKRDRGCIGQHVRLHTCATGIIHFAGWADVHGTSDERQASGSDWLGIELDEPQGQHTGVVRGVEYFTCVKNKGCPPLPYGILVRKTQIKTRWFCHLRDYIMSY